MPDRADLKVGFACNNRCVFCAQGDKRARCGAIDMAVLCERLRRLRAPSRGLVLTGGEPTGLRLVTEGAPLCFLRGMEDLAVEPAIPGTVVVDLDGDSIDYSTWRKREGKAHGPQCAACRLRPRCDGPWREYPDRLGWAEFRPLD